MIYPKHVPILFANHSKVFNLKVAIVDAEIMDQVILIKRIIPETIISSLVKKLKIRSSGKLIRDFYMDDAVNAFI